MIGDDSMGGIRIMKDDKLRGTILPLFLDRITILVSKYHTIEWDYNRLIDEG